jgi:30S ribosomal protein S31
LIWQDGLILLTLLHIISLNNTYIMGKGDKKSKRGKIIMGSYGVRRPQKTATKTAIPVIMKEESPAAKPKSSKTAKTEAIVEAPEMVAQVEEVVKPAKKKAPPKASAKEEKTEK